MDQVFCSPWVSRTTVQSLQGLQIRQNMPLIFPLWGQRPGLFMPFQIYWYWKMKNQSLNLPSNQNLSNFKSFILKNAWELNSTRLIWGMSLQLYFIKLPSCFVLKGILEKINPSPDQKWRCSSRKRKSISSTPLNINYFHESKSWSCTKTVENFSLKKRKHCKQFENLKISEKI